MPLKPVQIENFLRTPPKDLRGALFFGPEVSLVHERASALARTYLGKNSDPMSVVELTGDDIVSDPARLPDEAAQIPMFGGRRVIRVNGATESAASIFTSVLANTAGDALIVVEAGDIGAKAKLVGVFDSSPRAASIACYEESADSAALFLQGEFTRQNISASVEIVQELAARLGTDRSILRVEVEKLALYLGASGNAAAKPVSIADLDAALAGHAANLDDLTNAVAEGDLSTADRLIAQTLESGTSPVTILRSVGNHLTRLHGILAAMKSGASFDAAFSENVRFAPLRLKWTLERQAQRASLNQISSALAHIVEAERLCKSTGFPEDAISHRALLSAAAITKSASMRA